MKLAHRSAVLLPLLIAFGLSLYLGAEIFDRVPRLEDEMAELFQARVFASGHLSIPSPAAAESFAVPFVVDDGGRRFSKYPPGHAALLAIGVWLGDPWTINPLLGTVGLALTYALVKRFTGPAPALWAAWLGALSPFYLMTAGTAMQHPASLVFGTLFILGLLRRETARPALDWGAGLALGLTALVRPYTAALLALPTFTFLLLQKRPPHPNGTAAPPSFFLLPPSFFRTLLAAALTVALLPLYNHALTGELRLTLYTLYAPWERLGFGLTVGSWKFTPAKALTDTTRALIQLAHDLHGWPFLSLLLPLVGLAAYRRRREVWLLAAYPAILIAGHLPYFAHSRLYGPRYYADALPALLGLSALGARRLWSWLRPRPVRWGLGAALLTLNLMLYLPFRTSLLRTLYDGTLLDQNAAELSARVDPPALIFIFADNWYEAAAYTLANPLRPDAPTLDSPALFARYLGPGAYQHARTAYPDYSAYFYCGGSLPQALVDDCAQSARNPLLPASDPPPAWTPRYPTVAPPPQVRENQ